MIVAGLALGTIITFEPVRHNDFVNYDDNVYVTENRHVNGGVSRESVMWAFTTPHGGTSYWHPLTWLSHMLDCQFFGLNPFWHHITSLLFHTVNTLLLFLVLTKMTRAVWPSAFVAAVFALHPLHVESVAWISERKDLLSAFFWLLTIWAYANYAERGGIGRYMLVFVGLALGLMSKPMVVSLPFVLLLLDYWPLGRLKWGTKASSQSESICAAGCRLSVCRLVAEKIPLFILACALSVVTIIVQKDVGALRTDESFSLTVRVSNALVSYVSYITKMAFPYRLAVFYPHLGRSLPVWRVVASFLILAGISTGVIRMVRRRPFFAVGWLWYLGTLVPVIGLVQAGFQAMADRYTYLPSIGIFIIVAWGAAEISAQWRYRKILLGLLAGAVVICLLLCTRRQVRYWQNGVTLFEHTLEVTQNNYVVHDFLALAYQAQGDFNKELEHYRKALQIRPDYTRANNNLGKALQLRGNLVEAIRHYRRALQVNDSYAEAHNNLGVALSVQGNLDEAIPHFRSAIQSKENFSEAYCNLGNALILQGKTVEAQKHWDEAIQLAGGPRMHANIATALARAGEYEKALLHWSESLRLNPDQPMVENVMAETLYTQGKLHEAIEHWKGALQLKPDMPRVLNNLAWIMATYPDKEFRNPAEAVGFAERACDLSKFKNPEFLDTLSAAYAAAGKFNKAVQTAEKALKLYMDLELAQKADDVRNRLELFKKGQPYLEEP